MALLYSGAQNLTAAEPALGVKITCPYMPYSDTSSQIIYLTNPSTNAVNVVVKGFDETGTPWDLGMVSALPGRRITKMAPLLKTALENKGFTGGKMAFEFTTTNAAVRAYFSYNVGSVRGYVAPRRELFPVTGQSTNAPTSPALGLKIICAYMPYSASASQIIYITNPSNRATDIKLKGYDETGAMWDLGTITTADGRKVTKLSTLVFDKLQALGFTAGKLTLEFDCDNPEIMGYFSYNAGSVRGFVRSIRELYVLPPVTP